MRTFPWEGPYKHYMSTYFISFDSKYFFFKFFIFLQFDSSFSSKQIRVLVISDSIQFLPFNTLTTILIIQLFKSTKIRLIGLTIIHPLFSLVDRFISTSISQIKFQISISEGSDYTKYNFHITQKYVNIINYFHSHSQKYTIKYDYITFD